MITVLSWRVRALSDSIVALVQVSDPEKILELGLLGLTAYLEMRGFELSHVLRVNQPRETLLSIGDMWLFDTCFILHPEVWRYQR